ncbi:MAG: cation:proton antiporter [Vicinamibacterales bacterium]
MIPRVAALAVVIGTVMLLQQYTPFEAPRQTTALTLGLALIAATLLGEVAEWLRTPRLTGYLIFGLLCGPYMLNVITSTMARELQIVNGLAIALIALLAGLEINVARLRPRLRAIATVGGVTMGFMYVVLLVVLLVVWPWLPIAPEASGLARVAMALVLTAIVVSFSPTVTIAVIAESRSRGPLSELVVAVVVLADLVLILAFTLVMQLARTMFGGEGEALGLLERLSWEIFGSFAFGALAGGIFAVYLRTIGRELVIAVLALCVILSAGGAALELEPLLAALAAGLVVENVASVPAEKLRDAAEKSSLPVLVVFFAAAGASLQLDALSTIGVAAALVAIVRVATSRTGSLLGLRMAGVADPGSRLVWMGLVSQAGVTLGLATIVAQEFPDWGTGLQTLLVAMIALQQLVGPILFRAALVRAGEVGRMDESSPHAPAAPPGALVPAPAGAWTSGPTAGGPGSP